jgi:predicted RNase H-like nuclease (RuvC/YqgF family)
MLNVYE